MKLDLNVALAILLFMACTLTVAANAETIAGGEPEVQQFIGTSDSLFDENLEGKIQATYISMCLSSSAEFRDLIVRESKTDIEVMERLQDSYDRFGDSAWLSAMGQTMASAERLIVEMKRPSKLNASECESILAAREEIESVIKRAPRYN